jgi:hypothetical protein
MRRALWVGVVLLLLCGVSGCGPTAEQLVEKQIGLLNELADETRDPKEVQQDIDATAKQLNEMKLSEDQKKALREKHKAALEAVAKRLAAKKPPQQFPEGDPFRP